MVIMIVWGFVHIQVYVLHCLSEQTLQVHIVKLFSTKTITFPWNVGWDSDVFSWSQNKTGTIGSGFVCNLVFTGRVEIYFCHRWELLFLLILWNFILLRVIYSPLLSFTVCTSIIIHLHRERKHNKYVIRTKKILNGVVQKLCGG